MPRDRNVRPKQPSRGFYLGVRAGELEAAELATTPDFEKQMHGWVQYDNFPVYKNHILALQVFLEQNRLKLLNHTLFHDESGNTCIKALAESTQKQRVTLIVSSQPGNQTTILISPESSKSQSISIDSQSINTKSTWFLLYKLARSPEGDTHVASSLDQLLSIDPTSLLQTLLEKLKRNNPLETQEVFRVLFVLGSVTSQEKSLHTKRNSFYETLSQSDEFWNKIRELLSRPNIQTQLDTFTAVSRIKLERSLQILNSYYYMSINKNTVSRELQTQMYQMILELQKSLTMQENHAQRKRRGSQNSSS